MDRGGQLAECMVFGTFGASTHRNVRAYIGRHRSPIFHVVAVCDCFPVNEGIRYRVAVVRVMINGVVLSGLLLMSTASGGLVVAGLKVPFRSVP